MKASNDSIGKFSMNKNPSIGCVEKQLIVLLTQLGQAWV